MRKIKNDPKDGTLTTDIVVRKAVELADQEGVDAVSMRKLAGSLSVTAMSLYNHVGGKEALLDLMLNQIVAKIENPVVGGDWEDMMRRRAFSMRDVLLRHKWAPRLLISRINTGDEMMRNLNATVGCLVTAGFTYAQADWARNAIDSHIYGYTVQELNYPVEPDAYKDAASQYLPMIPKKDYPFVHEAGQQIIDGRYDGVTQFSFGLTLIIDGLKRWLADA